MPVYCKDCGAQIDDEALGAQQGGHPCTICGSKQRYIDESLDEEVVMSAEVHTKGYAGGVSRKKGLKFESKDGDSMSTEQGRFMKRNQLVDRQNNRYVKKVIDPVTGEVIRDVDEPLSDHTDRGAAKKNDS